MATRPYNRKNAEAAKVGTLCDLGIAAELVRIREATGHTAGYVAHALGWSPSKLSRAESGTRGLPNRELDALLSYYRVPPSVIEQILKRAVIGWQRHQQHPGEPFDGAEDAAGVRDWSGCAIPLLARTPAYAQALAAEWGQMWCRSPGDVKFRAACTSRWAEAVIRPERPLQLRAIMDEGALHARVWTTDLMRAQLEHLTGLDARGNVELRVLSAGGHRPGMYAPFTWLWFAESAGITTPDQVLAWQLDEPVRMELSDQETWAYKVTFDALWRAGDPIGPAVKRALDTTWR